MRIEYIYVNGYEEMLNNLDLNFGGPYIYKLEKNILISTKNEYYIEDFFRNTPCIEQISAIVGKNSSGKTTIIRMINRLFSSQSIDFDYLLIYVVDNVRYYKTNIKNISLKVDSIKKNDNRLIDNTKIIYFSSIFDKANKLFEHNNLEDISSNALLRDFVNSYYYSQLDNIERNNNQNNIFKKIKNKDLDIIQKFRKNESLLKLKYFSKINNIQNDSIFKSLFKSPEFLDITYSDDYIYKVEQLNLMDIVIKENKYSNNIIQNLDEIQDLVDEIMNKENYTLDQIQLKEKFKNEFLGMLIYEVFSILLLRYEVDIQEYTIGEQIETEYFKLNKVQGEVESTNRIVNDFYDFENILDELMLELEKYNESDEIYDDKIYYYVSEIEKFNSIITLIIENIKENEYKVNNRANTILSDEIPNEIRNEIEDDAKYEVDSDIITFINSIRELIKRNISLIDDNYIVSDKSNILKLRVKWDNDNAIEFIKLFNQYEFESLHLEYDHEDLSSGQNSYLDMISRISSIIEKIQKFKSLIVLIDEGDINLHPEVQAEFINNIVLFFNKFLYDKKIHVILTTNSPFIISDIPNSNILYVKRDENIQVNSDSIKNIKTFGSNINELLINSFYMNNGLMGTFAKGRIDYIINSLLNESNDTSDKNEELFIKSNIEIIGEELLYSKLKEMYLDKYGVDQKSIYDEIDKYKKIILKLEEKLKND